MNISVRSKKEVVDELDHLADLEGVDRAHIVRKILEKGLVEEKILAAISLYQQGNSLELAAEKSRVNIWDLIEAIHKKGITTRFELEDEKIFYAESLSEEYLELAEKILKM